MVREALTSKLLNGTIQWGLERTKLENSLMIHQAFRPYFDDKIKPNVKPEYLKTIKSIICLRIPRFLYELHKEIDMLWALPLPPPPPLLLEPNTNAQVLQIDSPTLSAANALVNMLYSNQQPVVLATLVQPSSASKPLVLATLVGKKRSAPAITVQLLTLQPIYPFAKKYKPGSI